MIVALVLASRPALIIGAGWFVVGIVVALVQRRRIGEPVSRSGTP